LLLHVFEMVLQRGVACLVINRYAFCHFLSPES
jgi:hypothetical protein